MVKAASVIAQSCGDFYVAPQKKKVALMMIRAGVAGAGVFGGYHANKYSQSARAELVGIFDGQPEAAEAAAGIHSCAAYTDYSAFLDEIDAVTIALPASLHYEFARAALDAGKHVLVEKPIALALDEADQLIALAAEKQLILQIGHQERYVFDAFGLLARARPLEVHSRRLNRFSGRAMDVSVVFDLMVHDLDMLNQVANGEVIDLKASGRFVHGDHADYVDTEISYDNGMKAVLSASRLEDEPIRDMRLVYEDGEIHIDFLKRAVTNTTKTPVALDFEADNPPPSFKDPLGYGTERFLIAIAERTAPLVDGAAGRAALELALRIEAAATQNKEE